MSDSLRRVGRSLSAVEAARPPSPDDDPRVTAAVLLVAVAAGAGAVAAVVVDVTDRGAFPTHPVSAVALGASAVAVWIAAARAHRRSEWALRSLSASLSAYLWLGVAACAVDDATLAAAWSAGWIPVNGLVVTVGLAMAAMPRSAVAMTAVTAVVATGAAVLAEPSTPFAGLPPAAPEAWTTRVPWLADALSYLFLAVLVLALGATAVRAARAHVTERRHLVGCAATVSMGLGLFVMCVALASLRDPGDIDPATGSVAYLVAVGGTAALSAYAGSPSRWPLHVVLTYWVVAVAVVVGVQVSMLTPTALAVALTSLVAVTTGACALVAAVWLERWSVLARPQLVAAVPALSARENDVLAGVAAGGTNAGIAADLFISERTVEQHLRTIYDKLDLGAHDSSNRRVRAAALWWQHQQQAHPRAAGQTG